MNKPNSTEDWKSRGFYMRTPPLILVSYDPAGDGDDKDALVMTSREEHQSGEAWDPDFAVATIYRVLLVHRMRPDLEFPDKLSMLLRLNQQLNSWVNVGRAAAVRFVVESNGVGYAMASSLRDKISNGVIPYTTVGSTTDKPYKEGKVSMPRLAALDHLRVLMETFCLKIDRQAPGKEILTSELASVVWRRPGRPEALDGQHDDAVMALTGACWIGSKVIPPILKQVIITPKGKRTLN